MKNTKFIYILTVIYFFAISCNNDETKDTKIFRKAIELYDKEEYKKAMTLFSMAIDKGQNLDTSYYKRANSKIYTGDTLNAIKDLEKAVEINPKYIKAHFNLGAMHYDISNYQESIDAYAKVIELDSTDSRAYYGRAASRNLLYDYMGAVDDCMNSIKYDEKNALAYLLRGILYLQIRRKDDACMDFRKAKELKYEDADKYIDEFCQEENISI